MAAILDQYGRPLRSSRAYVRGADPGRGLPYEPTELGEIDRLVPPVDWQALVSASMKIYANTGAPRSVFKQRAMFSVGSAWTPVYRGPDAEWGAKATEWLTKRWMPAPDVRGRGFPWRKLLRLISVSIDRDGDCFLLKTKTAGGYPLVQGIPGWRVGNGEANRGEIDSGEFKGYRIHNGIITDTTGRTVGYRIVGGQDGGDRDLDVPAHRVIHCFDPDYLDANRSLPAGAFGIKSLMASMKSHDWEEVAMMMVSAIGLIETNEHGGPDPSDPATYLTTDENGDEKAGVYAKSYAEGTVHYLKALSGGKLEQLRHDRPGMTWESFQDRVLRGYLNGLGWSYALAWKSETLNGTSQRAELMKVRGATEERVDLLEPSALSAVTYAVGRAIAIGILPSSPEWWKWGFTRPAKISIDPGRDGKVRADEWKAGATNMTEWLAEKSRTPAEHYRERAEEIALRKRIKAEVEEEYGVEIDEREMGMLTANEAPDGDDGDKGGDPYRENDEDEEENEEEDDGGRG